MGALKPKLQGIVSFYTNEPEKDAAIERGLKTMKKKWESQQIDTIEVEVKSVQLESIEKKTKLKLEILLERLAEEQGATRLYIYGHGSARNQTVGKWSAKDMLKLLNKDALRATRIRILGCRAARHHPENEDVIHFVDDPQDVQLANSVNSFAGQLCALLKNANTEIHANYHRQVVGVGMKLPDGQKKIVKKSLPDGMHKKDAIYQMPNSTIVFKWDGGVVRHWKEFSRESE